MIDFSVIAAIGFAILAMFGFALLVARLLRPAAFEARSKALRIPVTVEPPTLPDPFIEACPHCRALPLNGFVGDDCWSCGHTLQPVVPARPNQDGAA